ncbi:MAG: VWA domain-containing protein [Ferruginibacter sp.]
MTARDFIPNRLEASKQVAADFVRRRPTDKIGVVIFSGESFTLCPLTTDHAIVLSALNGIRNGLLEDGTAIGSGLSTSVDRLRAGTSKSKIILLLTDGINNGGLIDPRTAKEIAKTFGIKVYTIGVGSDGYAEMPINTAEGIVMHSEKVNIDEKLMTEIATETGGKYFRARENKELNKIYSDIDQLEKTKIEIVKTITHADKYFPAVIFALIFLFLSILLRYTVFNKFP